MRYVLVYLVLILGLTGLGLLASGRPLGFLPVLVALALVYRIIRQRQGRERDAAAAAVLVEVPSGESPREADRASAALEGEARRVTERVSAAQAKLGLASAHYASACLRPVDGLEAGAGQALDRARSLIGSGDAALLGEAQGSLERAAELAGRIESHLAGLENAAVQAHPLVERAELAVDRAWAGNGASGGNDGTKDQIVRRASELAREARAQLGEARPDWLRATSLAQRSLQLAGELRAAPQQVPTPAVSSGGAVESARSAAESAVAEVAPLVGAAAERTGGDNMAVLYLERARTAYADGVEHQAGIAGGPDPGDATRAALESFRIAVEAAKAAEEQALLLRGGATPRPTPRWGRLGTALGPE